jgi:dihydrofolate reductase
MHVDEQAPFEHSLPPRRSPVRKVNVFNSVSIDGYFTDANNDYTWAHVGASDPEVVEFTKRNARGENALVFGRITYEMMAAWWPTPEAAKAMPEVAKGMNSSPKLVFSRTLASASWSNTTLLRDDPAREISRIRETPGPDLTILGSGQIVAQLAQARLIDEVQLVICPVVLGSGRSLFADVTGRPQWSLSRSKTFENGRVFVAYTRVD